MRRSLRPRDGVLARSETAETRCAQTPAAGPPQARAVRPHPHPYDRTPGCCSTALTGRPGMRRSPSVKPSSRPASSAMSTRRQ